MDKVNITQLDFFDIIDKSCQKDEDIVKYKIALRMACEALTGMNDYCGNCLLENSDADCLQNCVEERQKYFLYQAEKEM